MNRRCAISGIIAAPVGLVSSSAKEDGAGIRIVLYPNAPEQSRLLLGDSDLFGIPVGLGRSGVLKAGSTFRGGYSLLGEFRVNAILSRDRFEMEPGLIDESGKSREWLAENLFSNMSSIDFDGDGKGGEYGDAFIGLAPINSSAKQPFHFGEYKGVFRWYSYAIHGTQDQARIGKCITGGCINVGADDLATIMEAVALGSSVRVIQES